MIEEQLNQLIEAIKANTEAVKNQSAALAQYKEFALQHLTNLAGETAAVETEGRRYVVSEGEAAKLAAAKPFETVEVKAEAPKKERKPKAEAPVEAAPEPTPEPTPEPETECPTPAVEEEEVETVVVNAVKEASANDDDLINQITETVKQAIVNSTDRMATKEKWGQIRASFNVDKISELKGQTGKLQEALEAAKGL